MKLITFSLWGDDPKYCAGAVRNAELASQIYPGWTCRFYIGSSTPFAVTEELIKVTKHWARYHQDSDGKVVALCGGSIEPVELEIYHRDEPGDWRGMFWRFEPASEDGVEVFISRDCDSRLTKREAAAVSDWLGGPQLIHVMRDHPEHSVPMLGGMWGAKHHAIHDIKEWMRQWDQEDRWQTDQEFLRDVIWPKNHYKAMVHDNWNRFPMPSVEQRSFPTSRQNKEFVGAIIGLHEERLHPEHHKVLND